jgi:hypothetical protein
MGARRVTAGARIEIAVEPLPDADAADLVELAGLLRTELLDTDVDRVEFAREGLPPSGAKAVDVLAIGSLVVELGRSVQVLLGVVSAVRSWVSGHAVRGVKIQMDGDVLEIGRASSEEQRRLIEIWIARHAGPAVRESG